MLYNNFSLIIYILINGFNFCSTTHHIFTNSNKTKTHNQQNQQMKNKMAIFMIQFINYELNSHPRTQRRDLIFCFSVSLSIHINMFNSDTKNQLMFNGLGLWYCLLFPPMQFDIIYLSEDSFALLQNNTVVLTWRYTFSLSLFCNENNKIRLHCYSLRSSTIFKNYSSG